jgi:hypothetical protein
MFMHPVLDKLLELKWKKLSGVFLFIQGVFSLMPILYTVGFVVGDSHGW